MTTSGANDIAIVGMAGLYPQADDIDVFWSNILGKVDAVTESSDAWLGDGSLYDEATTDLHKLYTRRGGFLGDLSRFDARSFGTMPLAVTGGQPDQFLALKLAHDALRDAGCVPGKFDSASTGVILGHAIHANRANTNGIQQIWFHSQARQFLQALFPDLPEERVAAAVDMLEHKMPNIAVDAVPGLVPNILTGRIANRLDLMGPNYIVDAACSSSLVAVDLAIGELTAGRADMMLAGGVNTTTSPLVYSLFCSVGALSRSGEIRPFDSMASGTVLGEGAGILVLKRLQDAVKADDRIYAVIKGVGQSSDGKSSGLMAPRLEGEVLAMQRAYRQTGIDPATIGLVEAHGTGIPLGDQTEVDAMRVVFGDRRGSMPTVPLGSIKSMIGHCIPASGSAAIIKMALALDRRTVPPTLCDEVSTKLGLETTPFYLSAEAQPWLHSGPEPRRAAINAFGFGGINAHMVLEEAPVGGTPDPTAAFMCRNTTPTRREQVFVFTAADRASLLDAVDAVRSILTDDPGTDVDELARRTWATAKDGPATERLAVVALDAADLLKKLNGAGKRLAEPGLATLQTRNGVYYRSAPIEGKIAFLFPGEMAQYPGMMRDAAMAIPEVREWFDAICALFRGEREVQHREVLFPPPNLLGRAEIDKLDRLLHQVDYGSELVFAADQAAVTLMKALGVKPDAMLGHSTGENAALVASGTVGLSRDDVWTMIHSMNGIFSSIEEGGAVPKGVLLTVAALDRNRLLALLEVHDDIHFTMDNCPNQAVLFGDAEAMDALQAEAIKEGAICTRLPISWGYHTSYVQPMAEAFGQLFSGVGLRQSDVTLYSCVTAKPFPKNKKAFRKTAEAQYTSCVRFTEAVEKLYEDGCRIFIECGPNSTLSAFVRDILGERDYFAEPIDSRRHGTLAQLRQLVARLFTAGVPMDADWLLFASEDAHAARRRATRDVQRSAPKLPSELVFARFDENEAEALRAIVGTGAAAPQPQESRASPDPAPQVAPASHYQDIACQAPAYQFNGAPTLSERPAMPWRPKRPDRGAMSGHIDLMRQFLTSHEPVTRAGVAAGARRKAATRTAGAGQAAPSRRVMVFDLADAFRLPFAFSGYVMQGAPTLGGMLPYLAERERTEAEDVAARCRDGRGWIEWSLSRLAVKRAAADVLTGQSGTRPAAARIEILKRDGGSPYAFVGDPSVLSPAISISHAVASGVGAACDARWRLGIDFDAPSRVRDPADFLDTILAEAEWRQLGVPVDASAAVTLWCLKEAAAKALGTGITGNPRSFTLSAYDPATGAAMVEHDGARLHAAARRIGPAICAIAYAEIGM